MKVQLFLKKDIQFELWALDNESFLELQKHTEKKINIAIVEDCRSLQQNRYLWKVFELAGNHFGYTKNEMKEIILNELKFVKEIVNKKTGEILIRSKETKNLTKSEFAELTEKILQFLAEYGFIVLTPEEYFEN